MDRIRQWELDMDRFPQYSAVSNKLRSLGYKDMFENGVRYISIPEAEFSELYFLYSLPTDYEIVIPKFRQHLDTEGNKYLRAVVPSNIISLEKINLDKISSHTPGILKSPQESILRFFKSIDINEEPDLDNFAYDPNGKLILLKL